VVDSLKVANRCSSFLAAAQIIPAWKRPTTAMSRARPGLVVSPEEGYGEFDSDLFETLPRAVFPADMELEEGLASACAPKTGEGGQFAYIDSVDGDQAWSTSTTPGRRAALLCRQDRGAAPGDAGGPGRELWRVRRLRQRRLRLWRR
jgi:hypothetical protein